MTLLVVLVWTATVLGTSCRWVGPRTTAVWAVLFTTCLYPQALTRAPAVFHVGMAPAQPQLRTYGAVLLVLGLAAVLSARPGTVPVAWVLLAGWLATGFLLVWSRSAEQWSGLLQVTTALAAWCAGSRFGRLDRDGPGGRALALALVGIVAAQCVVGLMQLGGVPINPLDPADAAILGNRINGTSNHPNNLGKMVLLVLMLLLPLTRSLDRTTRRLALGATVAALVPLALAQGRANFVGALMTVVLWAALTPRGQDLGARLWLLVGTGLLGLASAGVFLARFDEDPDGGARGRLMRDALRYLPEHLWTGMGPNSYTTVMSPRTGSFIPVHNSVLLAVAELGLLGGVLLLLPVVVAVARGWARRRDLDVRGDAGRALVASAPALLLVAMTGWGMLGTAILPLWFFVVALLDQEVRSPAPTSHGAGRVSAGGRPSPRRAAPGPGRPPRSRPSARDRPRHAPDGVLLRR